VEKTTKISARTMPRLWAAREKVRFMVRRKTLLGSSGEKSEDNAACHFSPDIS
jgi:hypothetical protein